MLRNHLKSNNMLILVDKLILNYTIIIFNKDSIVNKR